MVLNLKKTYRNPVIKGFYPDPSACKVDSDYYLVTSLPEKSFRSLYISGRAHWKMPIPRRHLIFIKSTAITI